MVAGHAIECGAQVTGGNYAFFNEIPGLEYPGFPIAEVADDGSCVITKHPETGGAVTVGTVTAQLLYEIQGLPYPNPDATARFDTIRLTQEGPDRVLISEVRGESPPERLKVAANYLGGFRNSMTLVVTGLDAEAKADLALRSMTGLTLAEATTPGLSATARAARSRIPVRELDVDWAPAAQVDPAMPWQAQSHLRLTVRDDSAESVGKPFTTSVIESTLSSYPGMFPTAPPGAGTPYGVYWPTTVDRASARPTVVVDGTAVPIPSHLPAESPRTLPLTGELLTEIEPKTVNNAPVNEEVPLGRLVGARSGDKGGNGNVGLWVPASVPQRDAAYAWLADFITPDRIRELLPEAALLDVEVHRLPNLHAVNIIIHGLLGRGVAETARVDPQAKGLGEHLRARFAPIPADLLPPEGTSLA